MKIILLTLSLFVLTSKGFSQHKFFTKTGTITFFSETPLENIKAINNSALGAIDVEKSEVAFVVTIKDFKFKNGLMEEHFNENYMESDKYDKAKFKGNLLKPIELTNETPYTLPVEGDLTIHGVSKKINFPATIEIKSGKIYARAQIIVVPKDYNIKIPSLVAGKIAKSVNISIYCILIPIQ